MAKRAPALPLRSKVNAAMKHAYVALYGQLGHLRPAWGTEASAPLDAWTSAQVLDLELPDSLGLTDRRASGMAWLESKQNANGSWTGQLFRKANGDVPATAQALLAMHDFGDGFTASTLSAYDWLAHTCEQGWMAAPVSPRPPDTESRHYATAYAVRALLRAPRSTHVSMAVHDGLEALLAHRTADGVWGYSRHGSSDVTFTCAVLHAFVEARDLWGFSCEGLDLRAGHRLAAGAATRRTATGGTGRASSTAPRRRRTPCSCSVPSTRSARPSGARACSACWPSSTRRALDPRRRRTICLTMANRSKVERASRSMRVTVTTSPGATAFSSFRSSRRSARAPVTFSR